jgi:hypothetical protein
LFMVKYAIFVINLFFIMNLGAKVRNESICMKIIEGISFVIGILRIEDYLLNEESFNFSFVSLHKSLFFNILT